MSKQAGNSSANNLLRTLPTHCPTDQPKIVKLHPSGHATWGPLRDTASDPHWPFWYIVVISHPWFRQHMWLHNLGQLNHKLMVYCKCGFIVTHLADIPGTIWKCTILYISEHAKADIQLGNATLVEEDSKPARSWLTSKYRNKQMNPNDTVQECS